LPGGVIERKPGVMNRQHRVIALRCDPRLVIPAVVHTGDLFEIAGNPVGLRSSAAWVTTRGKSASDEMSADSLGSTNNAGSKVSRETPESPAFRATWWVLA